MKSTMLEMMPDIEREFPFTFKFLFVHSHGRCCFGTPKKQEPDPELIVDKDTPQLTVADWLPKEYPIEGDKFLGFIERYIDSARLSGTKYVQQDDDTIKDALTMAQMLVNREGGLPNAIFVSSKVKGLIDFDELPSCASRTHLDPVKIIEDPTLPDDTAYAITFQGWNTNKNLTCTMPGWNAVITLKV